jgi:hypothetical protein
MADTRESNRMGCPLEVSGVGVKPAHRTQKLYAKSMHAIEKEFTHSMVPGPQPACAIS